jgi:hypothetical protein
MMNTGIIYPQAALAGRNREEPPMIANRTFGLELELHIPAGMNHTALAAFVRVHAAVEISSVIYTHAATPYWKVTTDGSLGDYTLGAEIVSPILRGEAGVAEARRVCAALKEFGCTVSVRCGFHVHIGIEDFSADSMRNLALYYAANEAGIDLIMPPSRRASTNNYLRSQLATFDGADETAKFNAACTLLKGARTTSEVIHRAISGCPRSQGTDRYRKLNFAAFFRQRTVEFRQHSGTIEADKVEHWLRFCMAMVERAPTARFSTRRKARPAADLFWEMLRDLKLSPESKKFHQMRRRELAKADALRAARRTMTRSERNALAMAEA